MKKNIQSILDRVLEGMGVEDVAPPVVSVPENPMHGDYSTNVAMVLFPKFPNHPKSPKDLADLLKNAIIKDQTISDAGIIDHVEVAGPGFINLYMTEASLINQVNGVLKIKDAYGFVTKSKKETGNKGQETRLGSKKAGQKQGKKGEGKLSISPTALNTPNHLKNLRKTTAVDDSARQNDIYSIDTEPKIIPESTKNRLTGDLPKMRKRVMVEFTDPNPFKELHIGHLYSNAVGESLSRLYEAQGWEVKRADYFGDVGMHVAKSIWGMSKLLVDEKRALKDIEVFSFSDRVHWLGRAYTLGATAYEGDTATEETKKDIQQINLLVYIAAQEYMVKTYGWTPVVDYRGLLPAEAISRLPEVKNLFEKGREWSMAYFESIFTRLGTKFDYYYPESIVAEYGAKLVGDHMADGTFVKNEGAVIFEGEKIGLHTRVFVNSKGLPTYEAKELGLNYKKYQDFPFDLSLIVTGKEINEYFRVLMAAMVRVIPDVAEKTHHIGHGMVRLPQGKMSSRTGQVITAEWLLDEAKKSIYNILETLGSKYSEKEKQDIAEKSAIAAIKYSFLRVNISSDIAFDIKASVSFEGDSGPYLQYTYARCKSVLRKSDKQQGTGDKDLLSHVSSPLSLNSEERVLARSILQFPDVVADAAQNFAPNTICTYLFHLAQEFNVFYAKHQILESDKEQGTRDRNLMSHVSSSMSLRLALTAATAQVIKNGLYLLGIATMEQM